MRAVSKKRAAQTRLYMKLRAEYLAEHEMCEFPLGCQRRGEVIHHTRGRSGRRLIDTAWWKASCIFHNDYAEMQTGHSLAVGWLHRIEGAA